MQTPTKITGFRPFRESEFDGFFFDFPEALREYFFEEEVPTDGPRFEHALEMPVYFNTISIEMVCSSLRVEVWFDRYSLRGNEYDFEKMALYINRHIFKTAQARKETMEVLMAQRLPPDVARLIVKFANVASSQVRNFHNYINARPLCDLVLQENFPMVTELLHLGLDPNISSSWFQCALEDAMEIDNIWDALRMTKLLLENGATVCTSMFKPTSKSHAVLRDRRALWRLFGMTSTTLDPAVVRDLVCPSERSEVNTIVDTYNDYYQRSSFHYETQLVVAPRT